MLKQHAVLSTKELVLAQLWFNSLLQDKDWSRSACGIGGSGHLKEAASFNTPRCGFLKAQHKSEHVEFNVSGVSGGQMVAESFRSGSNLLFGSDSQ